VSLPQTRANKVAMRIPDQLRPAARRLLVRYRHYGLTADDVVLAAYPKSGSTWLRFVLAGALSGDDMNFDVIRAVSPPVGHQRTGPKIVNTRGRLVKSHELPVFAPSRGQQPRVICLVRDGRDVAISYFHHLRRAGDIPDDFDTYFQRLLDGAVVYGSWQAHVRRWMNYVATASSPAVVVRYEDMLERPMETLLDVNVRCALGLDEHRLVDALSANTPERMRKKEAASRLFDSSGSSPETSFVRSAKAGGWHEEMNAESCARFETVAGRELVALGYPLSSRSTGQE
jgi:estrone sulfotransferase